MYKIFSFSIANGSNTYIASAECDMMSDNLKKAKDIIKETSRPLLEKMLKREIGSISVDLRYIHNYGHKEKDLEIKHINILKK